MFKIHRAIARALSTSTLHQITRTPTRVPPLCKVSITPSRTFTVCRTRFAEDQNASSQEIAASVKSTDEVPESAAPAQSGPHESTQTPEHEAAAVGESTDLLSEQSWQPQPASAPTYTVYVGNLYFEIKTEQLESHFGLYDGIKRVKIVTDPRGLSKGFGFIEFDNREVAERAIRDMHDRDFMGRRIQVSMATNKPTTRPEGGNRLSGRSPFIANQKPRNPPSSTLYIGNLSYQMTDRDLNDLFKNVQQVTDVRVAIDRRSGQPRGFAHADFTNTEAAQAAAQFLKGKEFYGRTLQIDYAIQSRLEKSAPSRDA